MKVKTDIKAGGKGYGDGDQLDNGPGDCDGSCLIP